MDSMDTKGQPQCYKKAKTTQQAYLLASKKLWSSKFKKDYSVSLTKDQSVKAGPYMFSLLFCKP